MRNDKAALNPIAISIAPTTRVIQKRYYDLSGTIEVMRLLWGESVIDGFEFQNLAEWDDEGPPRDDDKLGTRLAAWRESSRYTVQQIADLLQETGLPILSLHANRDIGICLCADNEQDINRGKKLIHESLSLAEEVGAGVCVFHLWDTWREDFDPTFLQEVFGEIVPHYSGVRASVENVPTHLAGSAPFALVREFEWTTVDLQWAAQYGELDKFQAVKDHIANVHLRGRLEGGRWVLDQAPFSFYEALDIIRRQWGYSGLLTMEPSRLHPGDWDDLVAAMSTLRAH